MEETCWRLVDIVFIADVVDEGHRGVSQAATAKVCPGITNHRLSSSEAPGAHDLKNKKASRAGSLRSQWAHAAQGRQPAACVSDLSCTRSL